MERNNRITIGSSVKNGRSEKDNEEKQESLPFETEDPLNKKNITITLSS